MSEFNVGEYYTGVCDEVRVVKRGAATLMEYGFSIGEFRQYTSVFLGSDKAGKDGKTNDDRAKDDLALFGLDRDRLDEDPQVMAYIRREIIGKKIEFQAEEYKGEIQFSGCRPPGMRRGPTVIATDNPFGPKGAASNRFEM